MSCTSSIDCAGFQCIADYCQPVTCATTGQCVHGQRCSQDPYSRNCISKYYIHFINAYHAFYGGYQWRASQIYMTYKPPLWLAYFRVTLPLGSATGHTICTLLNFYFTFGKIPLAIVYTKQDKSFFSSYFSRLVFDNIC